MATAIGNPHDPTSILVDKGKCDLVIHISDVGSGDPELKTRQMCEWIAAVFPNLRILVAYPLAQETVTGQLVTSESGSCRAVPYSSEHFSGGIPQVRSTQEYRTAFSLSQTVEAKACVFLANDGELLSSKTLPSLVHPILGDDLDLAVSAYRTNAFEGMVNSGVLYPLSRVICGSNIRYPLAPDLAVSAKAQAFLLQQPLRSTADQGTTRILWPVLDLELAGFETGQVVVGPRTQTTSSNVSLGDLITEVVGSLFSDIEAKASLWQRNLTRRQTAPPSGAASGVPLSTAPDPIPFVESFKLGASNLQEIWRLVLPPHSLLALKRLAQLPAQDFQMPDNLWVRIVYDFLLAHRSRTMSRRHLLGALTPLYLGWVASYVMDITRSEQKRVEERIESLAVAFEVDRPYLLSQWRWPDRFNP